MRRYQVTGFVAAKNRTRSSRDVIIATSEDVARRIFNRDHNVINITEVKDVTDVDTGWDHVAFVRSSSEPDRHHEIRRNRESNVVACGCLEYRFCRGFKSCHHLKALTLASASEQDVQTVTVASASKQEQFTVVRRSISLTPMSMQSIAQAPVTSPLRAASRAHPDPFDIENDHEAFRLLDLIDAEFRSDPTSVQCFDLRVVRRVKDCVERRKKAEQRGDVPPLLTAGRRRA